jgi:hypothetical protein
LPETVVLQEGKRREEIDEERERNKDRGPEFNTLVMGSRKR